MGVFCSSFQNVSWQPLLCPLCTGLFMRSALQARWISVPLPAQPMPMVAMRITWASEHRTETVITDKDQDMLQHTARRPECVLSQQSTPLVRHLTLISGGGLSTITSVEPPRSLLWRRTRRNPSLLSVGHPFWDLTQHLILHWNAIPALPWGSLAHQDVHPLHHLHHLPPPVLAPLHPLSRHLSSPAMTL